MGLLKPNDDKLINWQTVNTVQEAIVRLANMDALYIYPLRKFVGEGSSNPKFTSMIEEEDYQSIAVWMFYTELTIES